MTVTEEAEKRDRGRAAGRTSACFLDNSYIRFEVDRLRGFDALDRISVLWFARVGGFVSHRSFLLLFFRHGAIYQTAPPSYHRHRHRVVVPAPISPPSKSTAKEQPHEHRHPHQPLTNSAELHTTDRHQQQRTYDDLHVPYTTTKPTTGVPGDPSVRRGGRREGAASRRPGVGDPRPVRY